MRKLIIVAVVSLGLSASAAPEGDSADTLFLRDGSILQGMVVQDSRGNYHVYSPLYGEVSVDGGNVLYLLPQEEESPLANETHVIVEETLDVMSTFYRDIPETEGESQRFNLLVPGRVDSVSTERGKPVPFENRPIADMSLIVIEYADIQSSQSRLLIVSRQRGLLRVDDAGNLQFQAKRILDQEGGIRMILEYPRGLGIEKVSPEPVHRFEGLIVWEKSLKRQQTFLPTVTFRLGSGSSSD